MTNFVGRLGVTLGLNSAEFTRGIEDANRKLAQLQEKVKGYSQVAGAAFVAATAAAVRYADELVDVANANDVAISSIIQLRNALANSGGEASNASKLLSSFTQYIDKAAEGSFEAQKTLKGLGISFEDLRTLNMDELFRKAAGGLAAMEDTIGRNAKGMEVFNKAVKGVDLIEFNEQLNKTSGISKEHEEGIRAAAEAYDMLAEKGRRAMESLAASIGPAIKFAIQQLDKLTDALKVNGDELAKVAKQYDVSFGRGGFKREGAETPAIEGVTVEAAPTAGAAPTGAAKPPVRAVKRGVDKEAEAERKRILDNWVRGYLAVQQEIREGNEALAKQATELVEKEIRELDRRKEVTIKARAEEAETIEEANRLIAEQATRDQQVNIALIERDRLEAQNIERQKIMLELADRGRYMKASEYQLMQETLGIQFKYADLTKQIRENESLSANDKTKALERLINLENQELDVAKQRFNLAQKYQSATFAEGFADAMKTSMMNATTAFEIGQQSFQSMIGNMESAITRFVQTGKLSFKDLAKSIIADLIAIQLKAQATALFSGLLGRVFGAPSAYASATSYAATAPMGWLGFADGGDPPVNQPSIVGERGPELFVPKTAGTIVPNHQLASMMSSGQTVNYNGPVIQNMSAIDTQSGLEFLSRNKQAVWAANQSAQRSLPMNR